MYTVAHKNYQKTYHANTFSSAHIFCLISGLLMYLMPFIMGSYQKCKSIG